MSQVALFDARPLERRAHVLTLLPRLADRSRGLCSCGNEVTGATSDDVADAHHVHVEAYR